jgi:Ca-activated chloride channel homolog
VTARDDPLLAQWQYGLGRSVAWTSDSTGRWARDWVGWPGFARFFGQLVSWTFPGEETDGIEATFETRGGTTDLHVQSVEADGSPRDFYATTAVLVGPDLEPRSVDLVQVAPGVYQTALGEVDPGAYAVRITQTKPGSSPLGRTVGLVAPTAAEYRQLGANEPFLAALRIATGGTVVETASDPWIHDLKSTDRSTDMWPVLLVLAMLLWPLDIALRRMSIGRRELAAARGWLTTIGRRRRVAGPRTVTAEGLLAASGRVRADEVRVAMRTETTTAAASSPTTSAAPDGLMPDAATKPDEVSPPVGPVPSSTADDGATTGAEAADRGDTLARLRDAKRRARER